MYKKVLYILFGNNWLLYSTKTALTNIKSMPDVQYQGKTYYNPVEFALDKIGGKWKMPILWRLKDRVMRYGESRRSLEAMRARRWSYGPPDCGRMSVLRNSVPIALDASSRRFPESRRDVSRSFVLFQIYEGRIGV